LSYSKKPPKSFTALGEVIESTADVIDFHGRRAVSNAGARMIANTVTVTVRGKTMPTSDR
jgi:hypothetical protein